MDPHAPPSLLSSVRRLLTDERRRQATDRDLLQAFVQRNENDAFAELLRRHGPMVLHLALHLLHHRQDAEDVYQATFLTLARKAASLRCESSVAAWLHRVAWRLAQRSRAAKRRTSGVSRLVAIHQPADAGRSPDPAEEISLRESQEILHQELAALPEHLRSPLVLCYLQGRTRDEAARRLGWSLGTLIRRLEQGRKRLHARLSRRGVTLPALLSATLFAAAEVPASLAGTTLGLATSALSNSASLPAAVAVLMAKASSSVKAKAICGLVLLLGACAGAGAWAYCVPSNEPAAPPEVRSASNPPAAAVCEKPSEPANDSFGDPLPAGAVARLGTVRLRHGHAISGLAFSRDGKSIIASDYYSGVHVWDAADGKEIRRFYNNEYYCHGLELSPDGRTLAVHLGDGSIRLCDPRSGVELGALPKEERARLGSFDLSHNGSLLAIGGGDKSVRIWDLETRRLVRRLTFAVHVGRVSLSSDGKFLACCTQDGQCRLLDLAQGKEVRRLTSESKGNSSFSALFAPNRGRLAVWGYDDASVRLFDANGVKEIRRFSAEGAKKDKPPTAWGWAYSISVNFSPDGKILAIFREAGRIELWDVASGKKLHVLECDRFHKPAYLRFSPDGTKLASAGRGWGFWGDDNNGGDNIIRLWDVAQGKEILPLTGPSSPIEAVAFSPNGNTVATAGQDGSIHIWDRKSAKHLHRLEGHPDRWPQVAFSSEGRQLVWWPNFRREGTLRMWDLSAGKAVKRLKQLDPDTFWTAVSGDGKTAFSIDGKGKAARFHDLATCKVTREVADAASIASTPTRYKVLGAAGNLSNRGNRWELVKGGAVGAPLGAPNGRTLIAAVYPKDPSWMIMGDPPLVEIAIIDPIERKELRRFGKKIGDSFYEIDAVALSRDGKMVVTALRNRRKWEEPGLITLWETATGRERGHFDRGRRGQTGSLAISADGRFIVSGGSDASALVWDATRPQTHKSYGCECQAPAAVDLAAHFKNLAGKDAEQAYASMWVFINSPKTALSFFEEQKSLFERTDVRRIQRWVRELDSDTFAERERASHELGLRLDEAEPHLKTALQGKPSLELRRRIDQLLEERSTGPTERELQRLRVIEVLEHIAAENAAPGADATRLAAAALQRLRE